MSYQVLARKYRPQYFDELMGQDALVTTLTHAITTDKLAHAFLLCGIQGVGKTTTARIIAKTINCENLQGTKSCGECANCRAFANEAHPDIIEIDAASKTGIDDVREIIDSANYAPILGKYKVFIIDEVHMLSNNAFNALLKTLEEPPAHTKFIFATTLAKKIPLTILSRCQIFELRRFTVSEIAKLLETICAKEKVEFNGKALQLIAIHSDGSARDALSLLDRLMIAVQKDGITVELVEKTLGLGNKEAIYQLFDYLVDGKPEECLALAEKLYYAGTQALSIVEDLLNICNICAKSHVINDYFTNNQLLSDSEAELASKLSAKCDVAGLSMIWQMLIKGFDEIINAVSDISALEMLIIRICYLKELPAIDAIEPYAPKAEAKTENKTIKISNNAEPKRPNNNEADVTMFDNFAKILDIFYKRREIILYHHLKTELELIDLQNNTFMIILRPELTKTIFNDFISKLKDWTDSNWQFIISDSKTDKGLSYAEYEQNLAVKKRAEIEQKPVIDSLMKAFPGAKIENIN